jgi:putative hydrolase of the HAD superfamily
MTNRIKAVIFDYGNVIASFDVRKFIESVAPYSSLSGTDLRLALRQHSPLFAEYESGNMMTDRFLSGLKDACSLSLDTDRLVSAYVNIFTPIEETRALIARIKPLYRLGLLSNTSDLHFRNEIRTNPVFPLFDAVSLSYEVGARKPSAVIYNDMLKKLRLPPEECAYIDDIEEYADAAVRLGIAGIRYTDPDELLRSLRSVGVVVPD